MLYARRDGEDRKIKSTPIELRIIDRLTVSSSSALRLAHDVE